jgi:hypothetical protein
VRQWLRNADEQRATVWTAWATFLVPLSLAAVVGAASGQSPAFYLGMAIVSGLPVIVGVHDWIFDFAEWIEREKRRRIEAVRRAAVIAARGSEFRRALSEMSFAELRLLCQAFNLRLKGIARAADSLEVTGLLQRGIVYEEQGYTPGGFPFYFTDEAWVLINELPHDVFAARDALARHSNMPAATLPPMRPLAVVVPLWKRAAMLPPRLALTVVFVAVQTAGFLVFGHAVAAAYMLLVAIAAAVLLVGGWLIGLGIDRLF